MTFNYDVIVVGAGHAGRAAADDGDLLVKLLVRAGVHGRHVAVLGLHVLLGDARIKDAFDHDGHEQDRPDEL